MVVCLFGMATPAWAISLLVEIHGVAGPVKDNVLAHLRIDREKQRTDLTPLRNVPLQRLIFRPGRITKGIDFIREMGTLREIGPSFETLMPPEQFWQRFDQGDFD